MLKKEEEKLFEEYFSSLPEKLKSCFLENVYAVFFVEGMWYGGLTDFIFDENGNTKCVIYFNPATFNISLSDWLEKRDNTIFTKTNDKNKIKVECSNDYKTFLHTLTHEAVHVYDYVNKITPYMDFFNTTKTESDFYKVWADTTDPIEKYKNKTLQNCSFYYFGNQIPYSKANKLVAYLSTTHFSTLYGAKNFQDDLAETITFYFFRKSFDIDYKISCLVNGKPKSSYSLKDNQNVKMWDSLCKEITGF